MIAALRRGLGLLTLALGTALLACAPAFAAPGECPDVMPSADVAKGMAVTGWTVSSGTVPETFSATVLGVLEDGIGPGRDMIVVEAASPAITRAGGIWSGMSGSPVYDDVTGQLIGALGYGFSTGPSSIAGLTPADELAAVYDYPLAPPVGPSTGAAAPQKVALTPELRRTIARSTGVAADDVATTMMRLKTPFSVSGVNARGLRHVNRMLRREGLPLFAYAGASARAGVAAAPGSLVPGGNFAAAMSYGDVTSAGIGTTTLVCDGLALAFGHPFLFSGRTAMGANDADALTIIDDPTLGPYKLANIGGIAGTLDQDRLAAIRAVLGAGPTSVPVRSTVTALNTDRSRTGQTDIVFDEPGFRPYIAFIHLFSNIDSTFDAVGRGSSAVRWTIKGTRAGGQPFELTRSNVYASRFDVSMDSSFEFADTLDLIERQPFEDVELTEVTVDARVRETVHAWQIANVLVKKSGVYQEVSGFVRKQPGQRIRMRVILKAMSGSAQRVAHLSVVVPRSARRGFIGVEISGAQGGPGVCVPGLEGGEGGEGDGEEGEGCASQVTSFDALLSALQAQRKNNVLAAQLRVGEMGRVASKHERTLGRYIRGQRFIWVVIGGGGGCCSGPSPLH